MGCSDTRAKSVEVVAAAVLVVVVMEVVCVSVVALVKVVVTEDFCLCSDFEIFFYEFDHETGYVHDAPECAEENVIVSGMENG